MGDSPFANLKVTMTTLLRAPWTLRGDHIRDASGYTAVYIKQQLVNAVNAATADERGETPFVIWSNEHQAWWKPKMRGYTSNLTLAGVFSRNIAELICYEAGPTSLHLMRSRDGGVVPAEIMVRLEDAKRSTMWHRNNQEVHDAK